MKTALGLLGESATQASRHLAVRNVFVAANGSSVSGGRLQARVGPVASRADADRLKAQVASKVGIDGMVRPHP